MRNDRKQLASDGRAPPIVTYSRVPPKAGAEDDPEAYLVAEEVPFADKARGRQPADPVPEVHADIDPFDEPMVSERDDTRGGAVGRLLRLAGICVIVAIAAGFGVYVFTQGPPQPVTASAPAKPATLADVDAASLQERIDTLAASADSASDSTRKEISDLKARLAELATAKGGAAAAGDTGGNPGSEDAPKPVRQVSIGDSGGAGAAAEAPAPPPVPRARPAYVAPAAAADTAAAPTAKPAGAKQESDANFIASIEKTLATVPADPAAPAPGPAAPVALSGGSAPIAQPAIQPGPVPPMPIPDLSNIPGGGQ